MLTDYQKARNAAGFSQEQAAGELVMDRAKLSRIENGNQLPTDREVAAMAKLYRAPQLCNTYCVDCCEIGETLFLYTNGKRIFSLTAKGEKKKLCNAEFCVKLGALQTYSDGSTDLFGSL